MATIKINTVPGVRFDVTIYRGATSKHTIELTDLNDADVDLTSATVEWNFCKPKTNAVEFTWTHTEEVTVDGNVLMWNVIAEPLLDKYDHEQKITLASGFVIINYGTATIIDKIRE